MYMSIYVIEILNIIKNIIQQSCRQIESFAQNGW